MSPFAGLVWDLPGGAPAALALAAAGGVLTLGLAVRAMRRRPGSRGPAAWGAALARGAAVFAALLAAAAPQRRALDGTTGTSVVAAADGASFDGDPDEVLRWPEDAPDAASALEVLRAGARPGLPLDLTLVTGSSVPHGDAVRRALRSRDDVRTGLIASPAPTDAADAGPRTTAPQLVAPSGVTEGVPARFQLIAGGPPFEEGAARLTVGDLDVAVPLAPGADRVVTPALDLRPGTHLARVDVPGRPSAVTFVTVGAAPAVAYVARGARSHPIVAALGAQGLPVAALEPEEALSSGFGSADVVVLGPGSNGGALAARVSGRVRSGAGLLVLGGAGDDGLRRHAGTAVEELLPVTLPEPPPPPPDEPPPPEPPEPPPDEPPDAPPSDDTPDVDLDDGPKDALRIALLFVIDRSGSMRGAKIRLAQMATLAAARNLSTEDRVGVLSFDDQATWTVPFQDAGDTVTLARRIGGLEPRGGTDFFPALKEGFAEIRRQRCAIRHVILMTDGATRSAVFRPTVREASDAGVTLSTLAIGDGADTRLLGFLAGWGKGKLYLATNPERLPELVTVDTRRFTVDERERRLEELTEKPEGLPEAPPRDDVPDEPAADGPDAPTDDTPEPEPSAAEPARVPQVLASAAFLEGLLDATWPALPHPEEPAARSVALAVLGWDDGAPALVVGRAGESRVAVLAADAATQDAAELFRWERGGAFLAQLVRSLAEPPPAGSGLVASVVNALDGSARVALPVAADGTLRLRHDATGETRVVAVRHDGGRWSGGPLGSTPARGVWSGLFQPTDDGVPAREVALVSHGAPRVPVATADDLVQGSDAARIDAVPPARPGEPDERREPAAAPFLVAAAALLVAEAMLRRMV